MAYTARCMKCKQEREVKDAQEVEIKPGTFAIKGKCGVCGANVYKIIGKKSKK